MSGAYYNEIDPYAAAWLRRLILLGEIPDGEVDTRSIEDVAPDDLRGFTQHHFFAGIGGWSYALRLAGWPDARPVWTGSCPCQPFSQAGKGAGFADERHLWPAWDHLIREHRPAVIFGEQVASPAGLAWFDLVQADLEGKGYAVGKSDLCAAGVGAPHIRQRLYFVADDNGIASRQRRSLPRGRDQGSSAPARPGSGSRSRANKLGDSGRGGSGRNTGEISGAQGGAERGVRSVAYESQLASATGLVGDDDDARPQGRRVSGSERPCQRSAWSPSDFVWCRDGKWRPVEPGTFPLAHGSPARVGRLRAYGNAIVAPLAAEFIAAYAELLD